MGFQVKSSIIQQTKWRRGATELRASRAPDLWRPQAERAPREPDPVRAGRRRLLRSLEESRRRFASPLPAKRWL